MTTLLAAKLALPQPRDGLIPRERLAAWLDAQARARLVLVVAPAGFGKTTLLAQWALARMSDSGAALEPSAFSLQPSDVAWVSLDEGDNDPTRFWGAVAASIDSVAPGAGDHATAMLQSPTPPPADVVVAALLDELETHQVNLTLILDDYQLIAAETIHAEVTFLVDHLPPGLRLVIAGRGEPPLPLARWRMRGQLAELRVGELRFTTAEVAALAAAEGLSLTPAQVATLAERTEGWAGALLLAAHSLRASVDPQAQLAAFAGSHRHLYDYLADEVLRRQPAPLQRFLLDTSILERFCAELCDALADPTTGPDGASQARLDQLEAQGLFLLPLDEERRWYRYHALFAEFLRERLRREAPARPVALHRRAAAWWHAQAMPHEAVAHLLAAGDRAEAAALIEQEGRRLLLRSEVATVLGWLEALPAATVGARPALCLIAAWAAALAGRFEAVEEPLAAVDEALAAYAGDPDAPAPFSAPYTPRNLASEALAVRATVAGLRRETTRAVTMARQALAALPDDSVLVRGVVALMLGNAAYLQGDFAAAAPALDEAARAGQAGGMPVIAIFALRQLAELHSRAGQLHRAAHTYEDAIARGAALYPQRAGAARRPVPVAGLAYVGLGMLRYEWNELDAAETLLRDGLRLGRQGENVEILLMGPIGLARVQLARGRLAEAVATLAAAVAYARATGVPRLANWLGAEQARLDLSLGELASAAAWDQERRLDPDGALSYLEEIDFLALARLRIAQGRAPEALRLLSRLRGLADRQGRGASLVEIYALVALASRAAGDHAGAATALARAVGLAAPEGYLRSFVDLGEPMRAMLEGQLAERIGAGGQTSAGQSEAELAYLARLLAAFPAAQDAGRPVRTRVARPSSLGLHPSAVIDPLTPREREVLGWIDEGLRNEEIAAKLVVGVATVKKHINNLYAKLGVASRTQALKRSRELGLIE